jgi:hypothetical protein
LIIDLSARSSRLWRSDGCPQGAGCFIVIPNGQALFFDRVAFMGGWIRQEPDMNCDSLEAVAAAIAAEGHTSFRPGIIPTAFRRSTQAFLRAVRGASMAKQE